ncbi:MAG: valine--tRNA ligase [Parachlamydiales bacterium]|nr:valine--tRNA ligase [Parachlamydiales bacterium]
MNEDLPKAYDASSVEGKWYSFWEQSGFFSVDTASSKKPYCIIMPPPNVTGVLHMGHALGSTLQDILIRYKRMMGFDALWIPGTDHAGISTQTIVEKHLIQTKNKRRKDFSREEFLSHVWQWKEEKQHRIIEQIKKLGCSCDWSRLRFTMDNESNTAVRTLFKKMFDDGLIYRGDYLVNWDPVTQTALADDEVEHEEIDSFLWYFRYPFADQEGHIVIATTRPETLLGDTAIAVSPRDERYSSLIGKKVRLPLTNRVIPILEDHFVDPSFGTGAVKITPAHDHNDYQVALRHNLPIINIMTPDGRINEKAPEFTNLTMLEARQAVATKMKQLGLLEKKEPYKLRIGLSYRSKAIIEPFLSKQWFVRMEPFKHLLIDAVQKKEVHLIPKNFEENYFYWIENLRDWCISRQLWWGHRIPIWYHKDDPSQMICHDGNDLPLEAQKNPDQWIQDEDVLDTWFSSALWPLTTLGWPHQTKDLQKFYPTSTLITGFDILFFWVARMIFVGKYLSHQVPFTSTFIHGLIYGKSYWRQENDGSITYVSPEEKNKLDAISALPEGLFSRWEKMSKSKGNIIDPLEISKEYGTDAMRMALCSCATFSRQIDLDRRRFDEYKNFTNKIWNGARFVLLNILGENPLTAEEMRRGLNKSMLTLEDRWILSRINRQLCNMHTFFENYSFDKAAVTAYDFFWNDFCSKYLEIVKPFLYGKIGKDPDRTNKQKLLLILLGDIIRMLHPIAPFITEELFSYLHKTFGNATALQNADIYTKKTLEALHAPACIIAPFPKPILEDIDDAAELDFQKMDAIIYTIRNIRGEMRIALNVKTDIYFSLPELQRSFLQKNIYMIHSQVSTENIFFSEKPSILHSSSALVDGVKISIPLPQELIALEKNRLEKEREKLEKLLSATQQKLSQSEFIAKAPKEVVQKMENMLHDTRSSLQEILQKLEKFNH